MKELLERPAPDKIIRLQQVAKGEKTLDEFLDQMPFADLMQLLVGQDNILPGICLARHPMCGHNFEYMGEDPYLAGRIDIRRIRASARRVLELVMASPRFKATL